MQGQEHIDQAVAGRRTITSLALRSDADATDALLIGLDDDTTLAVADWGQSCCERRYMKCDDDLPSFVGAEFRGVETRPGPVELGDPNSDDACRETMFVLVHTSRGSFTLNMHNEHNGYYSGFDPCCWRMDHPTD